MNEAVIIGCLGLCIIAPLPSCCSSVYANHHARRNKSVQEFNLFAPLLLLFHRNEVFSKYIMLCAISINGTEEEIEAYAERVSEGYR